jgi:hypothetical protein
LTITKELKKRNRKQKGTDTFPFIEKGLEKHYGQKKDFVLRIHVL